MLEVAVAESDDRDRVASLLTQAFADDPVVRWILGERRRDRAMFETLLDHAHQAGVWDVAVRDGVPVGAAVWDRPGDQAPVSAQLRAVVSFLRILGTGIGRGLAVDLACEKRRPDHPHWYLAYLGAAVQGVGVGSAMLRAALDRIDGPAYLESSNEINIPLYERFGFEVTGEIVLPYGGPTMWTMYRRAPNA